MKHFDPLALAKGAVSAQPSRPATALAHDCADARVVIFRIEPGQQVAPHTSTSTVILSIASGSGVVSDAVLEREVRSGDVIVYEPGELHGMRALGETMVVQAIIAPRPGAR